MKNIIIDIIDQNNISLKIWVWVLIWKCTDQK